LRQHLFDRELEEVCPDIVAIRSVGLKDTTQVRLTEHDYVIEAFAAY